MQTGLYGHSVFKYLSKQDACMPKQTFFNLREEKRQSIEKAALEEFAEYGFDSSNMNRIVEQSNISKGSFYQYFEDKKDLYLHLINTLFQKKLHVVEPVMQSYKEHSFSHNLAELFHLGLEWSENDPLLHRLGEDFSTMQHLMPEFIQKYKPDAMDIYLCLLTHAKETGELREDIDIPITSTFISALINQTTINLMSQPSTKKKRVAIINELLAFIGRAILKSKE